MNRLTRKASKKELIESEYMFNYVDNSVKPNPLSNPRKVSDVYDKLGRLEDLEEQLGCPLEVVFKALTNGVYVNTRLKERPVENIFVDLHYDEDLGLGLVYLSYFYKNKDYKKTWWLKEDRSE